MANSRYPLILNGVKFQVNPTSLSISKPIVKGTLQTQSGTRFQIWYNQAEVLTINGISSGDNAYAELSFLKQNFERTSSNVLSELFYKSQTYRGFIDSISVGHAVTSHERWPYTVVFQLIYGEKFRIQDFSLNPSGAISQVTGFLENIINAPISRATTALNQTNGRLF
jgi:hypothetical protein